MIGKRFALSLVAVIAAVSMSACKVHQIQGGQGQGQSQGGGPQVPTTTTHVDSVAFAVSMPEVCKGEYGFISYYVYPASTSSVGTLSPSNSDVLYVGSDGRYQGLKSGSSSVRVTLATNGRTYSSKPLTVKDCSSTPPGNGGGTTVDSVVITPKGSQTFLVGQSEFYYARAYPAGTVTFTVGAGSCFTLENQGINASGYTQVKITAAAAGTGTLTASSGGKTSNTINFTCRSTTGTRDGMWIEVSPNGWTVTGGVLTKQFTAILHGAPANYQFKPWFYCTRNDIMTCVGEDRSFNNDPVLGTGSYKAGWAQFKTGAAGKGTAQACFQLSKFDNGVWSCVDVFNP